MFSLRLTLSKSLAFRLLLTAERLYLKAHGWRPSDGMQSIDPGGCWQSTDDAFIGNGCGTITGQHDAVYMQREHEFRRAYDEAKAKAEA